jgi:hypothetical protein
VCRRIGVCKASSTPSRRSGDYRRVEKTLYADTPTRLRSRCAIFIATLRGPASWLFFRVARSIRPHHLCAGSVSGWNRHETQSKKTLREGNLKGNRDFLLAASVISCSFAGAFIQEFKIPGWQFCHWWRHQYRRSTPLKGALNGPLWSADLVIKDVSDEILNSRTGPNSLEAI